MRDVTAYLVSAAVTLALLWDGAFARYEAILLILLYMLYLCVCVYTSRCRHTLLCSVSPDPNTGRHYPCFTCHALCICIAADNATL